MYAGLDIGRADDYTVLTIINQDGKMVAAHRWRHDEWSKIIEKVATLIKQYNATTLVEVNNQGDVFFVRLTQAAHSPWGGWCGSYYWFCYHSNGPVVPLAGFVKLRQHDL